MRNIDRTYLNTAKGLTIFLMLWGHCIQYCALDSFNFFENFLFKAFYSFHMPLFMLVSGYLYYFSFQKRNLKALLVHRVQGILQPMVFAGILNALLMQLLNALRSLPVQLTDGALLNELMYSFWFLWCVLAASIAVGIACTVTHRGWLQLVFAALGFFFVMLFPNLNMQLYMYPYFVIGFFFAKYRSRIPSQVLRLKYSAFVIFPVLLLFYETKHYIYITPVLGAGEGLWAINAFRWAIGLAGCVFVLTLLEMAVPFCKEKLPKLLRAVAILGENSLQIYCLSVSLLSGYLPIFYGKLMQLSGGNLFAESWAFYNLIFTPLLSAAYAAGFLLLIRLLRKAKLHNLIFGR